MSDLEDLGIIWEQIAHSPLPPLCLSWETVGNHFRDLEKPYITEAGQSSCHRYIIKSFLYLKIIYVIYN